MNMKHQEEKDNKKYYACTLISAEQQKKAEDTIGDYSVLLTIALYCGTRVAS